MPVKESFAARVIVIRGVPVIPRSKAHFHAPNVILSKCFCSSPRKTSYVASSRRSQGDMVKLRISTCHSKERNPKGTPHRPPSHLCSPPCASIAGGSLFFFQSCVTSPVYLLLVLCLSSVRPPVVSHSQVLCSLSTPASEMLKTPSKSSITTLWIRTIPSEPTSLKILLPLKHMIPSILPPRVTTHPLRAWCDITELFSPPTETLTVHRRTFTIGSSTIVDVISSCADLEMRPKSLGVVLVDQHQLLNSQKWCDSPYISTIATTELLINQNMTDRYAQWSPQGTYLVSLHRLGVALWGGNDFRKLKRFPHSGVEVIDFSPKERYMVTFSPEIPAVRVISCLITHYPLLKFWW